MATAALPWAELQLTTVEAVLFHLAQCAAPPLVPASAPGPRHGGGHPHRGEGVTSGESAAREGPPH